MSERPIDERMAALIKGMVLRGDDNSHIAAFFLINQGRPSEIANAKPGTVGEKYAHIKPAPPDKLPPPWKMSSYELWIGKLPRELFDY